MQGGTCCFIFRHKIRKLPRPISMKLCQVIGNRWTGGALKVRSKNLGDPQKWGASKIPKLAQNLAY